MLLLIELAKLDELAESLPAAFQAVLLLVELAFLDELVDAVSPLKVFEYLAMQRPVVAAPLPELHGMPYVFPALGTEGTP